ncbi:MAG: glycosyltransferase family 2 protein [Chitinophagales bacterium]|nr:glycosyltransferase family 2 protein [Chitinophagales bacterium]OJV25588.1 MAG: hypothetical protein BGO32_00830 [Bacteroidetes bacterium 37-13]HRN94504.1 glycosyltransferase [Chitinophagales bacterium]HRP38181.1 glycosyltransferase [Chitinophagales bacterium]
MQLSVIIVNYNVKHFLALCLKSVAAAVKNISAEVIVIDNNSTDGSVEMLQKTSNIQAILNKQNTGFAVANNQGIKIAKGKYVLLLNPDTVVAEDTFEKCIAFMEAHENAGALGVYMIDGKGNFLPESKRGLPTPTVAFYKMFGLSSLFPKSKIFGQYHLGFLDKNETHQAEILSGAFMFMRAEALQKSGLLDEAFFMYGEDIDLSYRIEKVGYKNYYFSDTDIIHYKGESTKKGSLNYVKVFYQAMIIFARKHFAQSSSQLFALLINFAIVMRGLLTLLTSLLSSSLLPLIDGALMFLGVYVVEIYWASNIKSAPEYYPEKFLFFIVPVYIAVWIISVLLSGGYERPYKISLTYRGLLWGTIFITAIYGLLPNEWRFSRAIILLGAVSSGVAMTFTKVIYNRIKHGKLSFEAEDKKNILVFAETKEAERIKNLLYQSGIDASIFVENRIQNLTATSRLFNVNEIIFSSASLSFKEIIEYIKTLGGNLEFKIVNPDSDAIIGSNSKNSAGDVYDMEKNFAIGNSLTMRKTRLADISIAILLLLFSPFFLLKKNGKKALANTGKILSLQKTWIGYCGNKNDHNGLPKLKPAVFLIDEIKGVEAGERARELNRFFASKYRVGESVKMLLKYLLQ